MNKYNVTFLKTMNTDFEVPSEHRTFSVTAKGMSEAIELADRHLYDCRIISEQGEYAILDGVAMVSSRCVVAFPVSVTGDILFDIKVSEGEND